MTGVLAERPACSITVAFALLLAVRTLPTDDDRVDQLLVLAASMAEGDLLLTSSAKPVVDLLHTTALAVALYDAGLHRPDLARRRLVDEAVARIRGRVPTNWSTAGTPRDEVEERFLLASFLAVLDAATLDPRLAEGAAELRRTTSRAATRMMVSLEGTW